MIEFRSVLYFLAPSSLQHASVTACRFRAGALLLLTLTVLSGCAVTTNKAAIEQLESPDGSIEIVLMPMDVELYLLTAGGVHEPRADWTNDAKNFMTDAIQQQYQSRGNRLMFYHNLGNNPEVEGKVLDIERLHSIVGRSILLHEIGNVKLPGKKAVFDWSLGKDISILREHYDADYALFIFVRDSYSSSGRVVAQIAAAALGVGMAGGQQTGFASLVDLDTGNIVWFNHLYSGTGDLRNLDDAKTSIVRLLDGLPE